MKHTTLVELDVSALCAKYLNGSSLRELAGEYGTTKSTIKHRLVRAGVRIRSNSEAIAITNHRSRSTPGRKYQRKSRQNVAQLWADVKPEWQNADLLRDLYCRQQLSTIVIATRYGVNPETVRRKLLDFGIPIRELAEANKIRATKEVWKEQSRNILSKNRAKIQQSLLARRTKRLEPYLDAEWLREQYCKFTAAEIAQQLRVSHQTILYWLHRFDIPVKSSRPTTPCKIRGAMQKKWQQPSYTLSVARGRAQHAGVPSRLQLMLYMMLQNLGCTFYREGPETQIGPYCYDCVVTAPKPCVIECQGTYWHQLPGASERDARKADSLTKLRPDWLLLQVWEDEFNNSTVFERLRVFFGIDLCAKPEFNTLQIRPIERRIADLFLDCYHYLGKSRGGVCLGVFHGTTLIACAVLSGSLRQNMQRYGRFLEISRFCINPLCQHKNLASWFLARIRKRFAEYRLVAYADQTVGHQGTIYRAAGFRLDHTVRASHHYLCAGRRIHKRTAWAHAQRCGLSENDWAQQAGCVAVAERCRLCFIAEPLK